jgi:molybdenum cofactor cytidylyltransferase
LINTAETMPSVGAIVLAAGFSRRFGSIKLNARLPSGHSLLEKSLLNLQESSVCDIIVAGRQELAERATYECLQHLRIPCRLVMAQNAELGMGHSLADAARVIPDHWSAALICLADMPYVAPGTLQSLMKRSRPGLIIVPAYKNRQGHPVCFGADFFPDIARSQGDSGARHVIAKYAALTEILEVNDPGIVKDIDHPGDLE